MVSRGEGTSSPRLARLRKVKKQVPGVHDKLRKDFVFLLVLRSKIGSRQYNDKVPF